MEKDKKEGTIVRPVYRRLFIAAIVIYIIGSCAIQSDLCSRLGKMEHKLAHVSGGH